MKYKLLVLDVDGTLLNENKEITQRTQAALLKAQQMGVHVVLASGRPTAGLLPLAHALELNNYGGFILSYNGGQIINVQTGELLFEKDRARDDPLPGAKGDQEQLRDIHLQKRHADHERPAQPPRDRGGGAERAQDRRCQEIL